MTLSGLWEWEFAASEALAGGTVCNSVGYRWGKGDPYIVRQTKDNNPSHAFDVHRVSTHCFPKSH